MGTIPLVIALLFAQFSQVAGQARGKATETAEPSPAVRTPPVTFFSPSGRIHDVEPIESEAVTVFRGRFAVTTRVPSYFANTIVPKSPILFVCEDYQFDSSAVSIQVRDLTAVKLGNLIVTGRTGRAAGDELVVEGEEVKLYRVSPNHLAPPIEEMNGRKITVDLKRWSATSDKGDTRSFTPPAEPRPRERLPSIFEK